MFEIVDTAFGLLAYDSQKKYETNLAELELQAQKKEDDQKILLTVILIAVAAIIAFGIWYMMFKKR